MKRLGLSQMENGNGHGVSVILPTIMVIITMLEVDMVINMV